MAMKLQVLVSAMNASPQQLIRSMNLQTDAVIINQCDKNAVRIIRHNGHEIKFISMAERGVGKSRNAALKESTADIVLFADDDVTYSDNYGSEVVSEFEQHPEADMIIFNITSLNPKRPSPMNKTWHCIRWYNGLRYPAYRLAVRRNVLMQKNITFSLLFGGGAKYMSGEDSLFIHQCRKAGMRIYASSKTIGTVAHKESTWFKGYTKQYFYDRGALYKALYPYTYAFFLFILLVRKYKVFSLRRRFIQMYLESLRGASAYAKEEP